MNENLENSHNIRKLIPTTTIGKLLLVKEGLLNGWWINFNDGRFTLDFRDAEARPPQAEDCCVVESVTQVDPSRVDEYIGIIEEVEELKGGV